MTIPSSHRRMSRSALALFLVCTTAVICTQAVGSRHVLAVNSARLKSLEIPLVVRNVSFYADTALFSNSTTRWIVIYLDGASTTLVPSYVLWNGTATESGQAYHTYGVFQALKTPDSARLTIMPIEGASAMTVSFTVKPTSIKFNSTTGRISLKVWPEDEAAMLAAFEHSGPFSYVDSGDNSTTILAGTADGICTVRLVLKDLEVFKPQAVNPNKMALMATASASGDPHDIFSTESDEQKLNRQLESAGRQVVLAATKAIPVVGSVISAIVGMLWPSPSQPTFTWDQINDLVDAMIKNNNDDQRLIQLNELVGGLQEQAAWYTSTSYNLTDGSTNPQKLGYLTSLISWFTTNNRKFLNDTSSAGAVTPIAQPEKILGAIFLFGHLHLAAMNENLVAADVLLGGKQRPASETATLFDTLRRFVDTYIETINRAIPAQTKQRDSYMPSSTSWPNYRDFCKKSDGMFKSTYTCTAYDKVDGRTSVDNAPWKMTSSKTFYDTRDTLWSKATNAGGLFFPWIQQERRDQVMTELQLRQDMMLNTISLWNLYDTTKQWNIGRESVGPLPLMTFATGSSPVEFQTLADNGFDKKDTYNKQRCSYTNSERGIVQFIKLTREYVTINGKLEQLMNGIVYRYPQFPEIACYLGATSSVGYQSAWEDGTEFIVKWEVKTKGYFVYGLRLTSSKGTVTTGDGWDLCTDCQKTTADFTGSPLNVHLCDMEAYSTTNHPLNPGRTMIRSLKFYICYDKYKVTQK